MPAAGPFETVWANQWEPPGTSTRQFAWRCYEGRFGAGSCINEDIHKVLDAVESGDASIPDFDLLVGGFPCQDYSVARPLNHAGGMEGKKGVLWWQIYRMLELKEPSHVLLENVDRLLKSPAAQRGRDFAIMLSCLNELGYSVEWRVLNAADYGVPQKRRRVYIFAARTDADWDLQDVVRRSGVLAEAFPVKDAVERVTTVDVSDDPITMTEEFGIDLKVSPFQNAGAMQDGIALTMKVEPRFDGESAVLGDVLVPDADVPEEFFIEEGRIPAWEAYRRAKKEKRTRADGFEYYYSEGAMAWPDPIDRPARTILTSEGGRGASRTKHAVRGDSGRIRRLVPDELDQLQGFPKGWTDTGMTDGQRAFCMGNALVVGIPHAIGKVIAERHARGTL